MIPIQSKEGGYPIPCCLLTETKRRIEAYADELRNAAPKIGTHGLSPEEFVSTGLFPAAVERLRGQHAASMAVKRRFLDDVLEHMESVGEIRTFAFTGHGDRHDYQIEMPDGKTVVFEAKGCLDGNNTTIFKRPPNADEFFIWSLCQNSGADPRKNAWSGIHTRLGAKILVERQPVDGLVIFDMVCGTAGRPCPKIENAPERKFRLRSGRIVPPPCIYLFPRTIPDPRNNPKPPIRKLNETHFLKALAKVFGCDASEITDVNIHVRMEGANTVRKTILKRGTQVVKESDWTELKQLSH
jgi:hypothetical protein